VSHGTSPALDEATLTAIERACTRLVIGSIRAFDAGEWQTYAQLFTEEGVFIRANEPDAPLIGRAAILAALTARPVNRLTRHLCTNLEIEVIDAEHAAARCYLLLYSGDAAQPASSDGRAAASPQRVGEYEDLLVRRSEGWRIAKRQGRLVFYTAPG
jgi:hypothetical protein